MIKQIINTAIIGLGIISASGVSAHQTNEYFHIHLDQPHYNNHSNHHYVQPRKHCVAGKKINQRQNKQEQRIRNGVRKGDLTHWEEKKLRKQQRNIHNKERHLRRSGNCLTRAEFKQLNRMLNQAGKNIRNKRHNQHYRNHHNNW